MTHTRCIFFLSDLSDAVNVIIIAAKYRIADNGRISMPNANLTLCHELSSHKYHQLKSPPATSLKLVNVQGRPRDERSAPKILCHREVETAKRKKGLTARKVFLERGDRDKV